MPVIYAPDPHYLAAGKQLTTCAREAIAVTRILVVEDEEHIRRVVALTLISEGYEITEAVHGLMGYSKAVSEQPHLIIMDLNMPVMDGLTALSKLKGNPDTEKIPVIILTARIDAASERECMQAGAIDYIKKPWGQQELEDRVAMALNYPDDLGRKSRVNDVEPDSPNEEPPVDEIDPDGPDREYRVKNFHLGELDGGYHVNNFHLEE